MAQPARSAKIPTGSGLTASPVSTAGQEGRTCVHLEACGDPVPTTSPHQFPS